MRVISFTLIAVILAACATSSTAAPYRAAIDYNAETGVSLLIMKDGRIVAEDYPGAGAPDKAWETASGTKSFSGVLLALAVKDGLLTLDEKVADTITEWQNDEREEITVRQLMTLTGGLETPRPFQNRFRSYASAIAQPAVASPGEVFAYGSPPFQVFGELIRRKLEARWPGRFRDGIDYLQAEVLNPIGVTPQSWVRGRDGYARLPSGARLTARDWARFGEFVRQGGVHEGIALVDPATLAENFIGTTANPGYGLTWWLNKPIPDALARGTGPQANSTDLYTNPKAATLPDDLVMAAGLGNQRLYIIPSKSLVIVRQQEIRLFRRGRGRDDGFSDVEFLLKVLDEAP